MDSMKGLSNPVSILKLPRAGTRGSHDTARAVRCRQYKTFQQFQSILNRCALWEEPPLWLRKFCSRNGCLPYVRMPGSDAKQDHHEMDMVKDIQAICTRPASSSKVYGLSRNGSFQNHEHLIWRGSSRILQIRTPKWDP